MPGCFGGRQGMAAGAAVNIVTTTTMQMENRYYKQTANATSIAYANANANQMIFSQNCSFTPGASNPAHGKWVNVGELLNLTSNSRPSDRPNNTRQNNEEKAQRKRNLHRQ